jgi:hypothetical protein
VSSGCTKSVLLRVRSSFVYLFAQVSVWLVGCHPAHPRCSSTSANLAPIPCLLHLHINIQPSQSFVCRSSVAATVLVALLARPTGFNPLPSDRRLLAYHAAGTHSRRRTFGPAILDYSLCTQIWISHQPLCPSARRIRSSQPRRTRTRINA